jgi:aspartate/methionine/tyrosine aminotransferase
VVESGDEVVLLDPAYETYEACVILAGGIPVSLQLALSHDFYICVHIDKQQ